MATDIFCKIINREIPDAIIWEDEEFIALNDIHPVAPVHILIIPKQHIGAIVGANAEQQNLVGRLMVAAGRVAKKFAVDESGYRLIINQGPDAGQAVPHLHMHLLAGKNLGTKIIHE